MRTASPAIRRRPILSSVMVTAVESLRALIIADSESVVEAFRARLPEIPWLGATRITIDHWAVERAGELPPARIATT